MVVAKRTQTNTVDTKYEYNNEGKLVHEVVTETLEIPDEPVVAYDTTACVCDYPEEFDAEEEYCAELEVPVSPLRILAGISCVASIIASGCVIFKTLKKVKE